MLELEPTRWDGVFRMGELLWTCNLAPGKEACGERLERIRSKEYRCWDPTRSKLAALLRNSSAPLPLHRDSAILYLGAASGTTASYMSDIAAGGILYCVEKSARPFRDLVKLAEDRPNLIPILADANFPEHYLALAPRIELLYQDIAQRNQVQIFLRNAAAFHPRHGLLMLKPRSIDVNAAPERILARVRDQLRGTSFAISSEVDLAPHQGDHYAVVGEWPP